MRGALIALAALLLAAPALGLGLGLGLRLGPGLGWEPRPAAPLRRRASAAEEEEAPISCRVQFREGGPLVPARGGETLLEVGLRSGEVVQGGASAFCKTGGCYRCEAAIVAGASGTKVLQSPIIEDGEIVRMCITKVRRIGEGEEPDGVLTIQQCDAGALYDSSGV